jgi:hypothetical protein
MARKSVIWNGYHSGDNLSSPVPNRTPSCSNAFCLHALVHIIEMWFISSSVNAFASQFMYCVQFKWCGRKVLDLCLGEHKRKTNCSQK